MVHSTSNESTVTALPVAVETDLRKTLFWDIQSPISPLNNGSYGYCSLHYFLLNLYFVG